MVKISNPTIIGITERKIDNSINDSEISSNGYCANWRNRNRKAGGAVCYVTNKIYYKLNNFKRNRKYLY